MSDPPSDHPQPIDGALKEAAVTGVRWMTGARIASDALQFFVAIALARLIAPAEFGEAAVALIFLPLSVIVTYEGFGSALVQRKEIDRAHLEAAAFTSLLAGLLFTAATFLLAPVVAGPVFSDEIARLIQLVSPVWALASLGTVSRALLSRGLDFRRIGLIETISLVLGGFASVGFAVAGLNAEAIVLGGVLSTGLASLMLLVAARPTRPRWHGRELAEITRFGAPASAAGLLHVGITNVDYAVLAARLGSTQVGLYWRAFQLGVVYQDKISGIMLRLAFPIYSRTRDLSEMKRLHERATRIHGAVVVPLLAVLIVTAPELVPTLFGDAWEPAVAPAQVLAVAGMIAAVLTGYPQVMLAAGRPRPLMVFNCCILVLYGVVVWFTARHGLVTVATAVVGVHVVMLASVYLILFRSVLGIRVDRLVTDLAPAAVPASGHVLGCRMSRVASPGESSGVSEPFVEAMGKDQEALKTKHAQAGMAMAAATFAMALASGIQAALYLSSYGIDGRTDGFFVAFALYTVFGVFSQSIRVTSAPLLVGEARLSVREFGATLALIALPVIVATGPLAEPLSMLLAPGLADADRAITQDALPILGGAMVLQLWAAGAATVLAVRDRFRTVAAAYIAGAGAGLICYLAVSGAAAELSMGWSMLAMAVVTCAVMMAGLRASSPGREASRARLRPARLVANAAFILGRTAVYLAFNALYLITLAFTSSFEPGDATVLSYAYLFASYLVAGTAFALGMSRIADMRRGALADWREVLADTVPHGFRYSMLLVAPAMAALVSAGAPLIGELFSASLTPDDVSTLRLFAALLSAWTVAALLVNLLLPAMFALGRAKLVNLLAVPLIVLHVAATAVGGALFGAAGVVGAAFVAPMCFAGVLLATGAREHSAHLARELARDGLRFAGLAAVCFAAGAVIASAVADGLTEALVAGVAGALLYAALAPAAAPQQFRLVMRALRPASA